MINDFLKSFWLNEHEIKIYLHLLSYWETIASLISKKLNINRTSIYTYLESLKEKWMVVDYIKNWVTYFKAMEAEDIILLCEQRERELKNLKKNADLLKNEFLRLREKQVIPAFELEWKIKYYEWIEAVSMLIDETLDEKCSEQLCFWLNEYHTKIHVDDWSYYTDKRVQKNIKVRSIQPNTSVAKAYKSRDKDELRETRLVPKDDFPSDCEINVMWDMIALFTTKWNVPSGMKMKNKFMARSLKSLFELAWLKAKDFDSK